MSAKNEVSTSIIRNISALLCICFTLKLLNSLYGFFPRYYLNSQWHFGRVRLCSFAAKLYDGSILILCIKRYYFFCASVARHKYTAFFVTRIILCTRRRWRRRQPRYGLFVFVILIELLFTKLKYSWVMVMMRIKKWMTHGNETESS